ncbi:hypothetical protein [Pseudomonas fluorescens]|uniref:hypothetical protein n=1 Tax=Pseudomonas fluorescens TaxID=294 RepID=UPI00068B3CB1|nr:hypothetical protein [Pseudomonas fluorescens]
MWWEKTIEYLFIIAAAKAEKLDFAAPLSGVHEHTGGDSIFGKAEKLILIEFKSNSSKIPTERSLFKNYAQACKLLSGFQHHVFVYGKLAPVPSNTTSSDSQGSAQHTLELGARPYFKGTSQIDASDVEDIAALLESSTMIDTDEFDDALDVLERGICKAKFDEYLEHLANLKKADGRSDGHVSPEQMSCVIGVNASGNIVSTQTLHDYLPDRFPNPVHRIAHTPAKKLKNKPGG